MSYVAIWLQACLHWRCAYFQTLSWNDTIFVVDWDILYKPCGSANKCSKGFVFSGKIWWQFFSCNKACSKYHTRSTTTPKYTLTQRLVYRINNTRYSLKKKAAFQTCKTTFYRPHTLKFKTISKYQLLLHWKSFENIWSFILYLEAGETQLIITCVVPFAIAESVTNVLKQHPH